MKANDIQVGGTHYSAEYQHWDMAMDYGLCHLAAAATKYLARYPKKNGLQDVEKAEHYVIKWIEREQEWISFPCPKVRMGSPDVATFMEANGVGDEMARVAIVRLVEANCYATTHHARLDALRQALAGVRALLGRLRA